MHTPRATETTTRRAAATLRPHQAKLGLIVVAHIACALLGLAGSFLMKSIIDDAIPHRNLEKLFWCVLSIFAAPAVANFIALRQAVWSTKVSQAVMQNLRNQLYCHLQRMSLSFYTRTKAGEIQSRLMNDVAGIEGALFSLSMNVIGEASLVIATMVALVYISPILSIVCIVLMPAVLLNTNWVSRQKRSLSKEKQQILASLSGLVNETLSIGGVLLMKTYGRLDHVFATFRDQNAALVDNAIRQQQVSRLGLAGIGILFSLIPALIFAIAGWQMITGTLLLGTTITMGGLIAFAMLQGRLFASARQVLQGYADAHAALVLFDRVFEYLDLPTDLVESPQARHMSPQSVQGHVCYNGVSFTYPLSGPTLAQYKGVVQASNFNITNISFTIEPGKVVALVGPSGSGKTTLCYLLPRLLEATQGSVTIDGVDVREIAFESLSALIGIVTQETFLLHASIRDNLLYANPAATSEQIVAAAQVAGIHERILLLDRGYDTIVGERGFRFSGGEKQRLAIARVILKAPRILIFDEATSALDPEMEVQIRCSLETIMKGRTTLMIAHRLATVISADLILVIENGHIVDRGKHTELVAKKGSLYHRLFAPKPADLMGGSPNPTSATGG